MPPAQSERKRRVLSLSNGHAEDLIAATIIEKLIGECSYCEIRALPLVGEGKAYESIGAKIVGSHRMMSSGGFTGFNPLWQRLEEIVGRWRVACWQKRKEE